MVKSLVELLYPHDPQRLFAAVNSHQRLALKTERADAFAALLPWALINGSINADNIASGMVEMSRGSFTLPLETMISWRRADGQRPTLKLAALHENCRRGVSVIINHIQRSSPDIAFMNAILERELRAPVHTNAYVSFGRGGAFKPHWDNHNVLILQAHGRKLWRGWSNLFDMPVDKRVAQTPSDPGPPDWEQVLTPGDVLYLPRGHVHQADLVDGDRSAHMTVTITPPRVRSISEALATLCELDPLGRSDIPANASADAQAAWMDRVRALMHAAIDTLDLDRLLDTLDEGREPLSAPSLGILGAIGDQTIIRPLLLRRPAVERLRTNGGLLRAGNTTWTLSAIEIHILDHATQRHSLTLDALCALMPEEAVASVVMAVEELASKGLLVLRDAPQA